MQIELMRLLILTSLVRENALVKGPWQHVHATIVDGSVDEWHPCSDHEGLVAVRHRVSCFDQTQRWRSNRNRRRIQ
eukprot:COSAG02_NODE_2325_length_9132_cov_16.589752_10_plen_76_part_00